MSKRIAGHDFETVWSACKICGGSVGSLTVACPARWMSEQEKGKVAGGSLDYRAGKWYDPVKREKEEKNE